MCASRREMEGCSRNPSFSYALAALVTVLLVFTSTLKTCQAATRVHPHGKKPKTNEFIRVSCGATTYPRVCIDSLSSYASAIQKNPRLLAHAALSVSLSGACSTSAVISRLSTRHGLKPRVVGAVQDCIETIGDSIDELRQSMLEIQRLDGPDFDFRMSNIQTWVSAALTDQDTCMDGFAGHGMNGKVKDVVRRQIVAVAQMTSNALALINTLASTPAESP